MLHPSLSFLIPHWFHSPSTLRNTFSSVWAASAGRQTTSVEFVFVLLSLKVQIQNVQEVLFDFSWSTVNSYTSEVGWEVVISCNYLNETSERRVCWCVCMCVCVWDRKTPISKQPSKRDCKTGIELQLHMPLPHNDRAHTLSHTHTLMHTHAGTLITMWATNWRVCVCVLHVISKDRKKTKCSEFIFHWLKKTSLNKSYSCLHRFHSASCTEVHRRQQNTLFSAERSVADKRVVSLLLYSLGDYREMLVCCTELFCIFLFRRKQRSVSQSCATDTRSRLE